MTDLDTLRQALQAPGDAGDPVDISAIIKQGRRLRRRRILTGVAGGACAAAAVFGAVTGITHLTRPSPGPGLNPANSTRSGPTLNRPAAGSPTPTPSPSNTAGTFGLSPTNVPSPSSSPEVSQPTIAASSPAAGQPSASPTRQPAGSPSASVSRTPSPSPTR